MTNNENVTYENFKKLNNLSFYGNILNFDSKKHVKNAGLEISLWDASVFLRTKYNWYIIVEPTIDNSIIKFNWLANNIKDSIFGKPITNEFKLDTYELAMNEAISNILNNIECN